MATGIKKVGAKMARGVVLKEIDWGTYLDLRDNPANDRVRMTFLDGTLHLISPEYVHDEVAELLGVLIRSVTKALGQEVKGIRSTTLRRGDVRQLPRGSAKEPDTAFFLGANERRMRTRRAYDLMVDPPPDLAIEIDNKSDSRLALPVYARIGVPEVWRYENLKHQLWFGQLVGGSYVKSDRSLGLPVLTPALVLQALDTYFEGEMGDNAWSTWVEGWAKGLSAPLVR